MRKPTAKEILVFTVLALIATIIIFYGIICLIALVIGIVVKDYTALGIGFGGLTLPLAGYVVIGDIKALFF